MTFEASLAQAGYELHRPESIWRRPGYAGIAYSDGDAIEERLGTIIARAADRTVLSTELAAQVTDWPSLYHLSGSRANVLRPFAGLLEGKDVLEIGAGCGALTRYLGECGARVLALEGTPRRAAIARSRTRELDNVTVVSDRFGEFDCADRFDVITLIGVLEYAPMFTGGDDPVARMLEQVRGLLAPGGTLIVAIENQLGLKYFAGCPEDHLGQVMYGVEGRYATGEPQTFGRKQLAELLRRAGFAGLEFLAPFPDYKLPVSIVTEQGFSCTAFDAGALAWQSARRDPQLPPHLVFAPELAWPVVAANGLALELANSFIVAARPVPSPVLDPTILAFHYSTGSRRAAFCKETFFVQQEQDDIHVRYHLLAGKQSQAAVTKVHFSIPDRAEYVTGTPFSSLIMGIVIRNGWTMAQVGTWLRRYVAILESYVATLDQPLRIGAPGDELPGACLDVVPQNILVAADGGWRIIDQEWVLRETMPVGWLLFRALLILVQSLTRFGTPGSAFVQTRAGFMEAAFQAAGMPVTLSQLKQYAAMEGAVQAEISGAFVPENWWGETHPLCFHLQAQRKDTPAQSLAHQQPPEAGPREVHPVAGARAAANGASLPVDGSGSGALATLQRTVATHERELSALHKGCAQQLAMAEPVHRLLPSGLWDRCTRLAGRYGWSALRQLRLLRKALEDNPLLDAEWYLAHYPDVQRAGLDPVRHYFFYGAREGKNPNPYFFTSWYLRQYPDVISSGVNPLLHYIQFGEAEGRNPCPYFFTRWYVETYPQARESGVHPLVHYLTRGVAEKTSPSPYFDAPWYLNRYPEIGRNGMEPLLHYLAFGAGEGRDPHPYFFSSWYLTEYPHVAAGKENPLLHFMQRGDEEQTNPNPYFDMAWYAQEYPEVAERGETAFVHYCRNASKGKANPNPYFDNGWYLRTYPDIATNSMDPLLHYILYGAAEGRDPGPDFKTEWYLATYPDVRHSGMNPLLHFIRFGRHELRNPNPCFDARWYVQEYPDAAESGLDPLRHYLMRGMREGRKPHPQYDAISYASQYCRWHARFFQLLDEDRQLIAQHVAELVTTPKLSVIMPVYNPPPQLLDEAIHSVRRQLYPHWQLCIVDDASTDPAIVRVLQAHAQADKRISLAFRGENGHISKASNTALDMVDGEFIALLDHDDLLSEDALFWVAEAIGRHPDAGLLYSDEDKIDEQGHRSDPYFKCDWNPFLFFGHNLICHLGVYRTSLVRELGGFRIGFEGAQDYDLAARVSERLRPSQIIHIPRILYHWRILERSTSAGIGEKPYAQPASERAINEHLQRLNLPGKVEQDAVIGSMHRVRFQVPDNPPLVSIIIPTRNGEHLVRRCIESIRAKTTYPAYEILLVDNGSDDSGALAYFAELEGTGAIRLLRDDSPFNFSRLNNRAAEAALGEVLLLLNNDTEVLAPDWLSEMVSLVMLPTVGAVGARLFFSDGSVQHAGVVLGVGGCASHAFSRFGREDLGYFSRTQLVQAYTALTAACLAVKKSVYWAVDGLDEKRFQIGYNDVDFCLKITQLGLWNVWTPHAELLHHESVSRGYEDSPAKQRRFWNEISLLKKCWPNSFYEDVAYNPNLTFRKIDFSLADRPRLCLAARNQPATLPKSLVPPRAEKPHLLIATDGAPGQGGRLLTFAELLQRQGLIASYAAADQERFFTLSPGVTGWFDIICLQGDPVSLPWFRHHVMRRLPYLVDCTESAIADMGGPGSMTEERYQSLVHSAFLSASSMRLLVEIGQRAQLTIDGHGIVVPDGLSFSPDPQRRGRPEGIVWRLDRLGDLPDTIEDILRAVDAFSVKHGLPVYCGGELTGALLGKLHRHVLCQWTDAADFHRFLSTRGPLLGIAPLRTDRASETECLRFSDMRMIEFGGNGIPGIYSRASAFCESGLRTGRLVDNSPEAWLQALEDVLDGGYKEEEEHGEQIRALRSMDHIAVAHLWPALERVRCGHPIHASTLWATAGEQSRM